MIGNATTKLAYSSEAAMAPVTNGLDLYKCHMLGEMAFLKSYHFPHSSDDTSIFMSFYPCFLLRTIISEGALIGPSELGSPAVQFMGLT